MPLLIIPIWHMSICSNTWIIVGMWHYFWFMDLFKSSIQVCWKSILYTMIGIRLWSLLVSNLNSHSSVFDCFLSLVLQLWLIWCCKNWKLLILLQQIPILPTLHLHCLGICHQQLFVYFHLLQSAYSGFCVPSRNSLPSHISCLMLEIFLAHVNSTVFTIYENFSSIWICSIGCSVLLFMPFNAIKPFIIFCGFYEHFLCSLCFSYSGPS